MAFNNAPTRSRPNCFCLVHAHVIPCALVAFGANPCQSVQVLHNLSLLKLYLINSIKMDKPKLDDQYIINEITAITNSLGKLDESDGTYMKDRDCKPCLRELLKFLNVDSNQQVARLTLGAHNIIRADLIPLLVQYCDHDDGDSDLFTMILRLCTNLTVPVLLLFQNHEAPTDLEHLKVHDQLTKHLIGYKDAFADNTEIWSTLKDHLKTEDDITFERLITLIRNILHIPTDSNSDFDAHEMCLQRMDKSGMLRALIEIAETQRGTQYCFHMMEIVYLILRNHNPETLASPKQNNLAEEKKRLAELSARRRADRLAGMNSNAHRLRNATFIVTNRRSIGDNQMIRQQSLGESLKAQDLDRGKVDLRKAKNKRPISSESSMSLSDRNSKVSKITPNLSVFCKLFVERIYCNYMQQIKHNLIQQRAQENDETYYLWAIQFFTAYNRHAKLSTDNISETLSASTLHFIQVLITNYVDKIKIEKKKFQDVSKRLHMAVRAYKEILYLVKSSAQDSGIVKSIKTILKETEYSTFGQNLLQNFEQPKHSIHYVQDLIETNDIFLEVLDPCEPEFLTRYCHPDIISVYVELLRRFETNNDKTNLIILKFLERVLYECKNETILCQASLFNSLLSIIESRSVTNLDRFKKLAENLFEAFGRKANKKSWMFQEMLFWKKHSDIIEIENAIDPPTVPPPAELVTDEQPQEQEQPQQQEQQDNEDLQSVGEFGGVADIDDTPLDEMLHTLDEYLENSEGPEPNPVREEEGEGEAIEQVLGE